MPQNKRYRITDRPVLLAELPPCDICKEMHASDPIDTPVIQPARYDSLLAGHNRWGYSCEKHLDLYGIGPATYLLTEEDG